jgi:hypothetical protein
MAARLQLLRPRPIGTASLSFRDVHLAARSHGTAVPADPAMVDDLRRVMDVVEWDEGGLADMSDRWGVHGAG